MINNLYIKATPTTAAVTWGSITGTLSDQTDLQSALNAKQDTLSSGTNIKTLEGQSLLGSGNIDLTKSDVGLANVDNTSDLNKPISTATQTALNAKQDTLVSGTNIKTINGSSVLGSGNLTISGGGGFNTPVKMGTNSIYSNIPYGAPGNTQSVSGNLIYLMPFIPANSFTTSNLFIYVTTLGAGVNARILLYSHSDTNGLPNTKIYESSDLSCSTNGIKTIITSQTFTAGTTYWLGLYTSGTVTFTAASVASHYQIGMDINGSQYTSITQSVAFGSAPSTFGTSHSKVVIPFTRIALTIA